MKPRVLGGCLRATVAALLLTLLPACRSAEAPALPRLAIEADSLTLSGVSSGGYMATQFQVAYSGLVRGAGIIAAGPWFCARATLSFALTDCLEGGALPPSAWFVATARSSAMTGFIDDTANLARQRVWVFHGMHDTVVSRQVTDALVTFYAAFVPPENLVYVSDQPAGHGVPTLENGVACGSEGSPWLNACHYDAAGALLTHLYGSLQPAVAPTGELRTFDQGPFDPAGSLAQIGYVYVPKTCTTATRCRLHIALHGCRQGTDFVGEEFVKQAGYNRWADANRLIVLYPQAKRSRLWPLNPNGCWDWWGYAGLNYATRDGVQLAALRAMVRQLGGF